MRLVTNSGMTFSGYWYGPKLLDDRVTSTGSPYVLRYESAMRSDPAFDAEYGERGSTESGSANEASGMEPWASSVEMCRNRSTPTSRATSHITLVPSQLVWTNSSGEAIDQST